MPAPGRRVGLVWLALITLLLGVLPSTVILRIDAATRQLLGTGLADKRARAGLVDAGADLARPRQLRAAGLPAVIIAVTLLLGRWLVRRLYHGRVRRTPAWDCGYYFQGPRAQDTAEGFSQPIRRIFEPMFRMERHFPTIRDEQALLQRQGRGSFLALALSAGGAAGWNGCPALIVDVQGGRIAVYLMYSFVTLIILLLVARP